MKRVCLVLVFTVVLSPLTSNADHNGGLQNLSFVAPTDPTQPPCYPGQKCPPLDHS